MPPDDNVQVGVFFTRLRAVEATGTVVELGGGEGNLVEILACHWNIENSPQEDSFAAFLGAALSSNPEHELLPPTQFDDFQQNRALYARQIWVYAHAGIGDTTSFFNTRVIPVYGLIRPRRQIMVVLNLWRPLETFTAIGLEVYYRPVSAPSTEREEVNRKYGKYRRS